MVSPPTPKERKGKSWVSPPNRKEPHACQGVSPTTLKELYIYTHMYTDIYIYTHMHAKTLHMNRDFARKNNFRGGSKNENLLYLVVCWLSFDCIVHLTREDTTPHLQEK